MPLDEYKKNLTKILTHPAVRAHKPRLILITPPPVEERRLEMKVQSQGYPKLNRTNDCTKTYSDAAREVGRELGVAVCDIWNAFVTRAGWKTGEPLPGGMGLPENEALKEFLHDGM